MKKGKKINLAQCRRGIKRIKFLRGLSLIYSFFMGYYLNSLDLSNSMIIAGYVIILIFSLIMLIYLDLAGVRINSLMTDLLERKKKTAKKKGKSKPKKEKP